VVEEPFDYSSLVDGFRCRSTEWVRAERERVVRERRRLHVRELALTRVLDERGGIDDSLAAADEVSLRSVRETVATARALDDLPAIASAAAAGGLSPDQLVQVVKVAGPDDDRQWAEEAAGWSPADLAHQARLQRTPTSEEGAARRAARELRFWWRRDGGMLDGRFSLPDVDGAVFESVMNRMIDAARPVKGQAWETRERRGADALVDLVRNFADVDAVAGPTPHLIVQVPLEGPATVAGIPLPDSMVEALRAQARVEPVLVDARGEPVAVGRVESVLSDKTKRVVRQRDGKCRWPGCDRRVGLEVHHLWPRSWGGQDANWNLASVCTMHHAQLVPQAAMLLLGNPNDPAGLSLVRRDDLADLAVLSANQARAGSGAAA
jgi:hypothetical protein